MLLFRGSVRVLDGLPVFRPLGFPQKHALCTNLRPRPFDVAASSVFLFQIRSRRSCRVDWLRRASPQLQARAQTRLAMGWACGACTFVNETGSACGVCYESAPGAPSSGDAKWTCEACTFVNGEDNAFCDMCENGRSSLSQPSSIPSMLGFSGRGTSFRPLRASSVRFEAEAEAGHVEKDAPVKDVERFKGPQVASGSTNPKSRKRKAKEAEVIDLSDGKSDEDVASVKDGKTEKEEESNRLLKNLHKERIARSRLQGGASALGSSDTQREKGAISLSSLSREQKLAYVQAEGTWLEKPSAELTVLTYNVWFREDLELEARLDAIGVVILQHRPDIVFFQEVTETIYSIFQRASWWKSYDCSVKPRAAAQRAYFCMQLSKLPVLSFTRTPFRNSVMGRELCLADLDAGKGARLLVATTHLESPCPAPPTWNQMFSPERVVQAKEAVAMLKDYPNVIFGGDMNWDDKLDGPPPLPSGWIDAWVHLHPGQVGFTYDTKANGMLSGNRSLQKRLDRMFCGLCDFEAVSIEMVGTKPIPDLTYSKEKKVRGQVQMMKLPVLPSDHFGLLLKLCRKSA